MALARGSHDRLAGPGPEGSGLELHDQLTLDAQQELVARLAVPAAVEASGTRVKDRHAVHRAELRVHPCGRCTERSWIARERIAKAHLLTHARIVAHKHERTRLAAGPSVCADGCASAGSRSRAWSRSRRERDRHGSRSRTRDACG